MGINTIEHRGQTDKAAHDTFSKEALKSLKAKLVGQALVGGAAMGGLPVAGDGWVGALQQSLVENLSSMVGQGIVYGDWRQAAKEAGTNLVVNTAAQMGAQAIGGKRAAEVSQDYQAKQIDIIHYISHKAMHAALGAATRAVHAKLSGASSKEIEDAALGGALGAVTAEVVGEFLMPSALNRIAGKLREQGLTPGTEEYAALSKSLYAMEKEAIKAYAQIAAVITAQALKADVDAAHAAALNAVQHNCRW